MHGSCACTDKNQSATRMRVNSIATFLRILFTVDLTTPKLAHCFSEELLPATQFASADEAHRKAQRNPWNSRMRVALSFFPVQERCKPLYVRRRRSRVLIIWLVNACIVKRASKCFSSTFTLWNLASYYKHFSLTIQCLGLEILKHTYAHARW